MERYMTLDEQDGLREAQRRLSDFRTLLDGTAPTAEGLLELNQRETEVDELLARAVSG